MKKALAKAAGKIPIIGPLVDFVISVALGDRPDKAAAGAVGAMLEGDPTKGAQTAGSIMQVLKSVTGGAQIDMTGADTNALKQALAGNILGGFQNITPNMLVSRASGQILQSNLELLFSGVSLRSFPFVFDFAPRDEKEAEMVAKIIKTIKMGMAPRKGRGLLLSLIHI